MRQFYIPTSSLNFNNIFSTESISPAAFYALRGFGYSRWATIPENEMENAILLYDSPCNFKRPASDLEDHPMLIEIRTDEEFPQIGEGLFYSDHTIYLNPWNTRIWFYNDKDKRTALSLSDSSLETKTLRLYNNSISVGRFEKDYMPAQISQEIPLNSERMEFDKLVNRYKGLLYGYYIGAAKSITPEKAELIHMLYTVQDTFMSIAASPDKKATPSQLESLSTIFETLKERSAFMTELVDKIESKEKAIEILGLLERYGVRTPLDDLNLADHLTNLRYNQNTTNSSLKWVRDRLEEVFKNAEMHLLHPDDSQIIVTENQLITLKCGDDQLQTDLFLIWANGLFMDSRFNGKISSQSFVLADNMTLVAKDFLGSDWESSPIRNYLNSLRHVVNGDDVTMDWNFGLISAVAAVVYKGDDWDKLLRFMQNQNMSDYRIAFATYGQLNGFANLTRDFTDVLLNQPSEYVANVYMEFYGQLFAKEICRDKMPDLSIVTPVANSVEPESYHHSQQQDNLGVELVTRRAFAIYHSPAFAKIAKHNLEDSLMEALMAYTGSDNIDDFMAYLAGYDGWKKTNKPWKSLYELLGGIPASKPVKKASSESKRKSTPKPEDRTLSLFADSFPVDTDLFHSDPQLFLVIKGILGISDEKILRQLEQDTKWFQGNYQTTFKGKPGRYAKNPKDNQSVLEHFRDYLNDKSRQTGTTQWLADIYKKINIDALVDKLHEFYK